MNCLLTLAYVLKVAFSIIVVVATLLCFFVFFYSYFFASGYITVDLYIYMWTAVT